MKNLSVIKVHGKRHVVNQSSREPYSVQGRHIPAPNYQNMGVAFCGILREGETLEQWCERMKKWKKAND